MRPPVTTLARSSHLAVIGAGALVAAVLAGAALPGGPSHGDLLIPLRFGGLALAVGACFALDDAAVETLGATPVPVRVRWGMRLGLAVVAVASGWVSLASFSLRMAPDGDTLPLDRMSFELLVTTVTGWAIAAAVVRSGRPEQGGATAGPALLVLTTLAHALPERWSLYAIDPVSVAHARTLWLGLLVAAIAVLAVATRDPCSRFRRPRARSAW